MPNSFPVPYKGSWMHHIILDARVLDGNLFYGLAVLLAVGFNYGRHTDSDGYSVGVLISMKRNYLKEFNTKIETVVLNLLCAAANV